MEGTEDTPRERAPELLSKLEVKPLRESIQRNYGDARGKARKYEPMPMAKTLVYKELLDIHSRNQVLRKLRNNLDDAQLLGYDLQNGVPQSQNIQYFVSNKLDEDAQILIEHAVETIKEKCRQKDLLVNVELVEEKAKGKEKSSRTKKRIKSDKTKEVSNFLKRHIIDDFNFPRSKNNKYDDIDFCEVLAYAGFQNMATNEAWDVLSGISDKDIPRSQTILKNIRDLDKSDIHKRFEKAIDKSVELEKKEGRINHNAILRR